jgi:hypothetical protein
MLRQKVWFLGIALSVALMLAGPAAAWEFTMNGSFVYEVDYRTQTGSAGFFGPFDADNGAVTLGAAASLNGWVGQQLGDMVSGTDGRSNWQYMTTNMDLRVNPAIRIRGVYYIGEWKESGLGDGTALGNLPSSYYLNSRQPGIQRSFSPGYWNTLWLTAQTPWGIVSLGKRPSTFGCGLVYNGEENRSSESTSLVADYGPLRFAIAFHPARRASGTTTLAQPPLGQTGINITTNPAATDYYNNDFDSNNSRIFDTVLPSITYRAGNIDMGLLMNWVRTHRAAEGKLVTAAVKQAIITRDRNDFFGDAYFKYNNGRFFFNSEFGWYTRTDRFSGALVAPNTPLSFTPVYIEAYRAMAEAGVLAGPAKASVIYAWMNGPDRRNGRTQGINQGAFSDHINSSGALPNPRVQSQSDANTGLFRPYSLLMVYAYGLGAYINADTNNGFADDASIFATRIDYAVAANLNIYTSFFWADRVGNGYGWGYLSPLDRTATNAGNIPTGLTENGQIFGFYRGSTTPGSAAIRPNIPDNNLGWEIGAGFDWKLLEGLLLNATFAYWQPGKWFNYACINKAVPAWDTQSVRGAGAFPFGVQPDRPIDAILGMELKVQATF